MKPWEKSYRLPHDVLPIHYDVYLFPNLEESTFSGKVGIEVVSEKPRNFFVVHKKFLNITLTSVANSDGESVEVSDAFDYTPNEFWVVTLPQEAPAGNYTIYLEYDGRLDNGILGFYKSKYTGANGISRSIATSKFQPTYARRALPCFDEPSFKSTFTTTLVKPSGESYRAISNMPESGTKKDAPRAGFTEVTFEKSVPMVTYLAIFVVADFSYIKTVTEKHKIPMTVYGTDKNKNYLKYAASAGSKVADCYETYFNIKYPLPKLDMAAIPDYSSGATEHWGLITYRETNLVYNPQESSLTNKIRVAMVIAHELAHQWFGNLMTVNWWNDLWLNEGFATYIEYKGVSSFEPDWDTESMFLTDDLHPVLDFDAALGSHPIVVSVETPDQINAVFDTISYSKGSSVIRMMENFMGDEDFRKGLTNFLRKYSYKTAVTDDLLHELTAVSSTGLVVKKIMDTWTKQKGYPVLTLEKCGKSYKVTQERFLKDGNGTGDISSPFDYRWEIPLTFVTSKDLKNVILEWFHHNDSSIMVRIPEDSEWMKFNVGQKGYYRVNYPEEEWIKFGKILEANINALPTTDRAHLLNDAFSLAEGGRLNYNTALNLTKFLKLEDKLAPWKTALGKLLQTGVTLYFSDAFPQFNKFLTDLLLPIYQTLNAVVEDNYHTTLLRPLITNALCSIGNKMALDKVCSDFNKWKNEEIQVPAEMREVVYCYGIKHGNDDWETWRWMQKRYLKEENPQEKVKLMKGLASSPTPWIIGNLLEMANDENKVRGQDYFTLLSYISMNRVGLPIVWDFYRNEWKYLVERFSLNDRHLGWFVKTLTMTFSSEIRLKEMEDFFKLYPEAGAGEASRKIALEKVKSNINFLKEKSPGIKKWLDAYVNE